MTFPFGRVRVEKAFTPRGVGAHVTLGIWFMTSVNWVPLKFPCRIGTW